MTGQRPSHFGDRLLHPTEGVAIRGCAGCARAHVISAGGGKRPKMPFKVAETHSFVDFSDSRILQFPSFGAHRAHAFMRRGRTPHLARLKRICRGCLRKGSKRLFCVFLRIPRARAEMKGNPLILCSPRTRAHDAHVFGATVLNRSARI
jgi:hypothetical protein